MLVTPAILTPGDDELAAYSAVDNNFTMSLPKAVVAFAVSQIRYARLVEKLTTFATDADCRVLGMNMAANLLKMMTEAELPSVSMPRDTNAIAHVLRWIPQAIRCFNSSSHAIFRYPAEILSCPGKSPVKIDGNIGYARLDLLKSAYYCLIDAVATASKRVAEVSGARATRRLRKLQEMAPLSSALEMRR